MQLPQAPGAQRNVHQATEEKRTVADDEHRPYHSLTWLARQKAQLL